MIGFLYALPVVLFFVAIGMLFLNLKKSSHLWIGIGVGFLGLILLLITLALVYLSQNDQHLLLTTIEQQEQEKENQIKQRSLLLTQLIAIKLQPGDRYDRYTQYGLSVTNPFFLQLDNINKQIKTLTAKPGPRSKNKVNIYRLPQDSNQLLLADYLRSLGYQTYIPESDGADEAEEEIETAQANTKETEEKQAKKDSAEASDTSKADTAKADHEEKSTETDGHASTNSKDHNDLSAESSGEDPLVEGDQVVATSTTDLNKLKSLLTFKKGSVSVSSEVVDEHHDGHAEGKTISPPGLDRPVLPTANVMYYGSSVSDYDIKVIALALMRAGIPLRGIRTFKESNRPYDVELDWTTFYEKRPIIAAEKIVSKKNFER